jgi:hypothetical protein
VSREPRYRQTNAFAERDSSSPLHPLRLTCIFPVASAVAHLFFAGVTLEFCVPVVVHPRIHPSLASCALDWYFTIDWWRWRNRVCAIEQQVELREGQADLQHIVSQWVASTKVSYCMRSQRRQESGCDRIHFRGRDVAAPTHEDWHIREMDANRHKGFFQARGGI